MRKETFDELLARMNRAAPYCEERFAHRHPIALHYRASACPCKRSTFSCRCFSDIDIVVSFVELGQRSSQERGQGTLPFY
jgi:hypothetical protein